MFLENAEDRERVGRLHSLVAFLESWISRNTLRAIASPRELVPTIGVYKLCQLCISAVRISDSIGLEEGKDI